MSLEKKAETLMVALTDFVNAVTSRVAEATPAITQAPAGKKAAAKGPTAREMKEAHNTAKDKAAQVVKEKGKDALKDLLKQFDVTKFNLLKKDAEVYKEFTKAAESILKSVEAVAENSDDLLGDPQSGDPAVTIEDVRAALVEVNEHPKLGKETTRQILSECGVTRLPELKKEDFAKAIERAKAAIKTVGNEQAPEDDLGI